MEIKFIVLFYSKYSQFSKNMIQTINSSQIDFVNNFKLSVWLILKYEKRYY